MAPTIFMTLRAKTPRGEGILKKHGALWHIRHEAATVQFSAKPGPWLLLETKDDMRWVHAAEDTDFVAEPFEAAFESQEEERLRRELAYSPETGKRSTASRLPSILGNAGSQFSIGVATVLGLASPGLAIMIIVSALFAWLVSRWLGGSGGAVVAVLAFVAWGLLNRRSGEHGLFVANLKSYFIARRSGQSVEQALKSMIEARYFIPRPDLSGRQTIKRMLLESLEDGKDAAERVRVVSTVLLVWHHEHDAWFLPPEQAANLYAKVDRLYEEVAARYGFPTI